MKKKLLHERLRDWEYSNETAITVLTSKEAEAFADEIEKYYIPRPRYEDGRPVQFKNEFVDHNGHNQTLSSLTYTKGSHDYVSLNGRTKQRLDEPVNRKIKVLDADGVEIMAGDTVWLVGGSISNEVKFVTKETNRVCIANENGQTWVDAFELTHIEPDSLEKLRDDMRNNHENWETDPNAWLDYADRLTALMERDK
nr:MAG TPA: hypothetical protein [Caudoviricetes sp.]